MNPILLKPDTDCEAQVIALGKPDSKIRFIGHADYQTRYWPVVLDALEQLRNRYDLVVIEGAGSPAEVNLKARDIVNMNLAKAVQSPVILVGDIDWGGVFAQLVGTYELLEPDERALVKAFLINKFRGDLQLLAPGVAWLEERTGIRNLGVVPFLSDLEFAEEDSIHAAGPQGHLEGLRANTALDAISGKGRDFRSVSARQDQLLIDVLWLPRISNFTDFDPLRREPGVVLRFLHQPDRHSLPDLVILPGTKSTIADLEFLRQSGLADYLMRCYGAGVPVLGICGGFQMLGERLLDPDRVESKDGGAAGLGLLPCVTHYRREKTTVSVRGTHVASGCAVEGYEIHMGQTSFAVPPPPLFRIYERQGDPCAPSDEGVFWTAGKAPVYGTYLHGLFDQPDFLRQFLDPLRLRAGLSLRGQTAQHRGDSPRSLIYDRLADRIEPHLDMEFLEKLLH
jgi:cobyric acid synthase